MHMLAAMHAVHRRGEAHFWELGMLLDQCFKASEARLRDRDWTVGWALTGLPDPRPQPLAERGLSHPSEYAAGIARLKEMQALANYRATLGGQQPAPAKGQSKGAWNAGGGGQQGGGWQHPGGGGVAAMASAGGGAQAQQGGGEEDAKGGGRGRGKRRPRDRRGGGEDAPQQ